MKMKRRKARKQRKATLTWWKNFEDLYPTQESLGIILGHKATKKEIEKDKTLKHPTIIDTEVNGKMVTWKPLSTRHLRFLKTGKRKPSNELLRRARIRRGVAERYYTSLQGRDPDKTKKQIIKEVRDHWRKTGEWITPY